MDESKHATDLAKRIGQLEKRVAKLEAQLGRAAFDVDESESSAESSKKSVAEALLQFSESIDPGMLIPTYNEEASELVLSNPFAGYAPNNLYWFNR